MQNLVALGVLVQQEQTLLWFFPVQRYFLTDDSVQLAIIDQVRTVVLEDIRLDSRTAALISLTQPTEEFENTPQGGHSIAWLKEIDMRTRES